MPKPARKPCDIEAVKERIRDTALEIIVKEGFSQLSMRKIASSLKMTAANIYNYFSNKDEIYLAIQTKGFEVLYKKFSEIAQSDEDPVNKIKQMISAYIEFGIKNADQYEIMFTRNTPKYKDYIGTKLENTATIEKQTALDVAEKATLIAAEFMEKKVNPIPEEARYSVIQFWVSLHGIVSLYNSRVLQEVENDVDKLIERLSDEMLEKFMTH